MESIAHFLTLPQLLGAQWLSGRVLDSRPRDLQLEPHWCHCVVSLNKNINLSFVLVQPRKNRPFIAEILLMGHNESIQTSKHLILIRFFGSKKGMVLITSQIK